MAALQLRICHLYPDLLNLYGDRGNILALQRRCAWRGIESRVAAVSLGQPFIASDYDLVFLGGGQDYEQNLLHRDLLEQKGPAIRDAVGDGLVFLCICGGYQLMGQYYEEQDGHRIECLGAIDIWTVARPDRMIGDTIYHSAFLEERGLDPLLVGFENHSGRTSLGPQVRPLARVVKGCGNNGQDHSEGAVCQNVICTYSHGSFLPKNPQMADYLIYTALSRRYGPLEPLAELPQILEENARKVLLSCK
ncbi:MAG TPA: glutamine amidotransferase [Clostridiales bacterium]|nr:glutamine amidotransferase [Clostridiales bacterium]